MDTRTWTDDELRSAVADATSWRGVCRALSLKATSAGALRTVKRHARRLELETGHFTHQRTWSDAQLREAVSHASTWADVLARLGLADRGEARARIKGRATRLGLDASHLGQPSSAPISADLRELRPTLAQLRAAAEPIAIAWFVFRGVPVATPTEPSSYDFLATLPSGVQRVQVKTSTRRADTGGFIVTVGRRYSADESGNVAPYDPDEIDYFFIVDGEGGLYLVPMSVLAGKIAIDTRAYRQYRLGDASSLFTTAA